MINKIIEMLLLSDFYGESENIDIAKGKYKFTNRMNGKSCHYWII